MKHAVGIQVYSRDIVARIDAEGHSPIKYGGRGRVGRIEWSADGPRRGAPEPVIHSVGIGIESRHIACRIHAARKCSWKSTCRASARNIEFREHPGRRSYETVINPIGVSVDSYDVTRGVDAVCNRSGKVESLLGFSC